MDLIDLIVQVEFLLYHPCWKINTNWWYYVVWNVVVWQLYALHVWKGSVIMLYFPYFSYKKHYQYYSSYKVSICGNVWIFESFFFIFCRIKVDRPFNLHLDLKIKVLKNHGLLKTLEEFQVLQTGIWYEPEYKGWSTS